MRDAANISKSGRPVILFVHDKFERAARTQASGLGVPDMKIYVFPQYAPGMATSPEEARKGEAAVDEVSKLLIGN